MRLRGKTDGAAPPATRRGGGKPRPLAYGDGSISQRKSDGRWIVRVRQHGKYDYLGSSTDQQGARKILDEYQADLAAGLNPSARDWGTSAWLGYYLETKLPVYGKNGKLLKGVEPTTFEKYETQIRRHIEPAIGKILADRLALVDAPQCQRWFNVLCGTGLGADVLNEALQRLSAAMDLAVDYDLILRNPCRRIERPRRPERAHVKPSELDLARLIRAISGDPLEALVWIAMGAGPRRGEVAALQWEDVSIFSDEHGIIHFHRRRNRLTRRTQARFDLPSDLKRPGLKRQPERFTDIGSLVVRMLRQRWQHQLADRARAGTAWKGADYDPQRPSGYVFTASNGTPLDVDAISGFMTEVRERAGLDIERFHALRRVFTTLMNKAGVPDRVTMEQAGHKRLDMTHYYKDPMASQKREGAQLLDVELQRLYDAAMTSEQRQEAAM
jgi:integrase